MARKPKLTETQKLVMRAAYEKYFIMFGVRQKALEKVAEEFGIHWQTARDFVNQSPNNVDRGIVEDVKKHQASKIDKIVNKILDDLENADRVFKGMSPAQAVLALSQLIDKAAKLKGDDIQKIEIHEVGERVEEKLKQLENVKAALLQSLKVPNKVEDN